jgi:hypothetical protein
LICWRRLRLQPNRRPPDGRGDPLKVIIDAFEAFASEELDSPAWLAPMLIGEARNENPVDGTDEYSILTHDAIGSNIIEV